MGNSSSALKSNLQYQPDRNFNYANNIQRFDIDQTQRKTPVANELEVETVMLDDSGNSSYISGFKPQRRIVRYRSEEERLADQLDQTQTKLRMAIEQGQKLRAKTNRYEDELRTLKIRQDQGIISDSQWKKKYYDLDKQHRNLKEDFDVLVARNKNGRDFLRQQEEVIDKLNNDLAQERVDKQELLHGSLSSLSILSEGGTKSKKAKRLIQQLETDKRLLEDKVRELTERNMRGREYLNKLELEKRQQENIIAELDTDLHNVKSDRNELLTRLGMSSSIRLHENQEFIDFTDENKASSMGERYLQLYDNEWNDAFTELSRGHNMAEREVIQTLLDILTITFQHCQTLATSQLDDIEKTLRDFNATAESLEGREFLTYLKSQRKMKYSYNLEAIKKSLDSQLHSLLPTVEPKSATKAYIKAVIDLCWLLNVQDPPCTVSWDLRRGEPFQADKYRIYRHSGRQVDYIVWPVLYVYQGGGVLCKGVAQALPEKHEDNEHETIIVTTVMPLSGDDPHKVMTNGLDSPVAQKKFKWSPEDEARANRGLFGHNSGSKFRDPLPSAGSSIPAPSPYEEMEFNIQTVSHEPGHTAMNDLGAKREFLERLPIEDMNSNNEITENGPNEYLYAAVNKPKFDKQRELYSSNKSLEEVEFVTAEEECITRF